MAGTRKELIQVTQDELTKLEGEHTSKCKYCGKSIWYETTKITFREDGQLASEFRGTTWRTSKTIDGVKYDICVCQHCLEKMYPDFADKNKHKIFNTFNKYVQYAFDIPQDVIDKKNKMSVPTLENCIRKHGEKKGREVFDEYKRKQAYSNTFEYKQEKYGWTKEQFDEYNKSRAVTIENLINRHGEEDGLKIWNHYIERQSETSSNEYILNEYGEEELNTILLLKAGKKEGFILRYGEEDGVIKYDEYISQISDKSGETGKYRQSKIGLSFFDKLSLEISKLEYDLTYYYGESEFRKYSHISNALYSLDFYIPEIKLDIEFNGNYWHANPEMYDKDWFHPVKKMYAKDIWEYDKLRNESLKKEFNIVIFDVWEKSIVTDGKETIIIEEIIELIKELYVSRNNQN